MPEFGPPLAPECIDPAQERHELFRPVVGPAKKRLAAGREKTAQRPAALPLHEQHGGHVIGIHIGAELPIHLDTDAMRVQDAGHGLVVKALLFHDMAPVAGGIADG